MDQELTVIINEILNKKLNENDLYVRITFYELRIKYNLTEQQTDRILELMKNKLEKMNYQVYFTGARFEYQDCQRLVQPNELMIAIKNITNDIQNLSNNVENNKKRRMAKIWQ